MQTAAGMPRIVSSRRRGVEYYQKQWITKPLNGQTEKFAAALKISPLLAQVLINRGVTEIETAAAFLRPKLTDLISPEEMPGIETAVKRITKAIKQKEKITIYGDYDVDGIAGVAILWQLLTMLGADVDYYIPHRVDEGYGLNNDAVRSIAQGGTKLLITVDCGITAVDSAALAAELGLELIITDHHCPESKLPKAAAIVHPALEEGYANFDSSGALVAFKLAWAMANKFSAGPKLDPQLRDFMINSTTLAAMATVADCLDLTGENRALTSYGLKTLADCGLCGIEALIESAGLTGYGLNSSHIGFRLAPMLNAAGRMGHARLAVELLTTNNSILAHKIAENLKDHNSKRQSYERKILKHACDMIKRQGLNQPDQRTIVLADMSWHTGVIGIVASRIVDKFHRPTIIINSANYPAQGSARSIEGFDVLNAIQACGEHLFSYGGHKAAAGINIKAENIPAFTARFEEYAKKKLEESDLVPKLHIDAHARLSQFTKEAVNELKLLEPFGRGNPRPVFATKGLALAGPPRTVGAKNDHLQLTVTDNTATIRCIAFGMGKLEKKLIDNEFFSIAYTPQINTYNGLGNVEFVLSDIQFG